MHNETPPDITSRHGTRYRYNPRTQKYERVELLPGVGFAVPENKRVRVLH